MAENVLEHWRRIKGRINRMPIPIKTLSISPFNGFLIKNDLVSRIAPGFIVDASAYANIGTSAVPFARKDSNTEVFDVEMEKQSISALWDDARRYLDIIPIEVEIASFRGRE